jgi:phosphate transport system permease protein
MVYTTTVLLIVIVVLMNVTAIGVRNHLREKFRSAAF